MRAIWLLASVLIVLVPASTAKNDWISNVQGVKPEVEEWRINDLTKDAFDDAVERINKIYPLLLVHKDIFGSEFSSVAKEVREFAAKQAIDADKGLAAKGRRELNKLSEAVTKAVHKHEFVKTPRPELELEDVSFMMLRAALKLYEMDLNDVEVVTEDKSYFANGFYKHMKAEIEKLCPGADISSEDWDELKDFIYEQMAVVEARVRKEYAQDSAQPGFKELTDNLSGVYDAVETELNAINLKDFFKKYYRQHVENIQAKIKTDTKLSTLIKGKLSGVKGQLDKRIEVAVEDILWKRLREFLAKGKPKKEKDTKDK